MKGILKAAREMGVDFDYALECRARKLADDVEFYCDLGDEVSMVFAWRALDELIEIKESQKSRPKPVAKESLTDEEIDRARQVPISRLIDFRHGKARAWCHDDKNPSLFHATRTNRASCPVCAKYFDPIAVLMERDGYSFVDAVRTLQRM